jgi:hypothetical protein
MQAVLSYFLNQQCLLDVKSLLVVEVVLQEVQLVVKKSEEQWNGVQTLLVD